MLLCCYDYNHQNGLTHRTLILKNTWGMCRKHCCLSKVMGHTRALARISMPPEALGCATRRWASTEAFTEDIVYVQKGKKLFCISICCVWFIVQYFKPIYQHHGQGTVIDVIFPEATTKGGSLSAEVILRSLLDYLDSHPDGLDTLYAQADNAPSNKV